MKKSGLKAFQEAVRFENEGREYFLTAASNARNETTRAIFEQIAEEELLHVQAINRIYQRLQETGSWVEDSEDLAGFKGGKNRFQQVAGAGAAKVGASSDDIQALERAAEIEKKGKAFYEKKAQETEVEFEKKFFTSLAVEEEGHYLSFVDACDYLADPESWFLRKEGGSRDGG